MIAMQSTPLRRVWVPAGVAAHRMGMTRLRRAERVGKKFMNPVPTDVGGLKTIVKVLQLFLTNREERVPKRPLGPFYTDASVYATPPASGLRVTWFGHSSMLVEIDGVRLLIDPVWDERASPVRWFGPRRFFAPTMELEALPPLDAVLISHDHYDHLGRRTVERLAKLPGMEGVVWVTPIGVGGLLQEFGVAAGRIEEVNWTQSVRIAGRGGATCELTALPARHFSGRSAFNRFQTLWASFVLRGARHNIYYGADSGEWDGFAGIGAQYGPFDLTMLEIGAFNELWKDIHMGPDGAARTFRALGGAGLMMPIHWGLFDLALHAWRQPIERLLDVSEGIGLWAPVPGRPTEVMAGEELRSGWWRA
jgi:L-ascorbate metabolism protein UlaG (beta-lactamase superfamily)